MAVKKSSGVVAGLKIKIDSIEFGKEHPFRKLQDLNIPISKRITLICGHNGVGKSTILGMLASASGLTKGTDLSYFGRTYEASVNEILFIDHAKEVAEPKKLSKLSEPKIKYDINGKKLTTVCSLRQRGKDPRARVVSQRTPINVFKDGGFSLGPEAKIPLPTLYLGLTRMLPVGETSDSRLQSIPPIAWHVEDEKFLSEFIKRVIPNSGIVPGDVTVNMVKGTKKISAHPAYGYGAKSVSVGQDSLGAIATALASFHRIRRILGDKYPGGLLIIDELDACFHPHAIGLLVSEMRKVADDLNIQVVATTHSPRLIEAVHPETTTDGSKDKDGVIYLRDTKNPKYDVSMGFQDVIRDMDLTPPDREPDPIEIKVYFEDDEARQVFDFVSSPEFLKEMENKYKSTISPMPIGIGCSSLANLPSKDPYFKSVILAVDADGSSPGSSLKNLVSLPGGQDSAGAGLSPERTLIAYIRCLVNDQRDMHPFAWADPRLDKYSVDSLEMNLLRDLPAVIDRKKAKKWWQDKYGYIVSWGLYEYWVKENEEKIKEYEKNFEAALKVVAKECRAQIWNAKLVKRR